jgi:hypothetical protein
LVGEITLSLNCTSQYDGIETLAQQNDLIIDPDRRNGGLRPGDRDGDMKLNSGKHQKNSP